MGKERNDEPKDTRKINLICDTCIWNDDGLCDRLGRFVDPDDKCSLWERVNEENNNANYKTESA